MLQKIGEYKKELLDILDEKRGFIKSDVKTKKSLMQNYGVYNYKEINFFRDKNNDFSFYTLPDDLFIKYYQLINNFFSDEHIEDDIDCFYLYISIFEHIKEKVEKRSFIVVHMLLMDIEYKLINKKESIYKTNKDIEKVDALFLNNITRENNKSQNEIISCFMSKLVKNQNDKKTNKKNFIKKILFRKKNEYAEYIQLEVLLDPNRGREQFDLSDYEYIIEITSDKNSDLISLNKDELEMFYNYLLSKISLEELKNNIKQIRKTCFFCEIDIFSLTMALFLFLRIDLGKE